MSVKIYLVYGKMKTILIFLILTIKLSASDSWSSVNNFVYDAWVNDYFSFEPKYDIACNYGIFRSVQFGNNWYNSTNIRIKDSIIDCYGEFEFFRIVRSSNAILISIKGGNHVISFDDGLTWEFINDTEIGDIKTFYVDNNDKIYAGTDDGIFISLDNGYHWSKAKTGLNLDGKIITEIKSNENSDIYACSIGEIIKFNRQNNSWDIIKIDSNENLIINSITFIDKSIYIATDKGIFSSNNDGFSWSKLINNISEKRINSIEFIFNKIWAGTDFDGLFVSEDTNYVNYSCFDFKNLHMGRLKIFNNFFSFLYVLGYGLFNDNERGKFFTGRCYGLGYPKIELAFFNKSNNMFYLTKGNIFYSVNSDGFHPLTFNLPLKKHSLFYFIDNSNNLYYSDFGYPLYKSKPSDYWYNWKVMDSSLINIINMILTTDGCLFALNNTGKIFVSRNNGDNWKSIDNLDSISHIAYNRNGNILATSKNKFNISKDNGNSWDAYLNSFQGSFADSINMYQFIDTSIIAATSCGIYYTDDFGSNWAQAIGIPCININNIVRAFNELFASCDSGIYRSLDLGKSWFEYNNGMPRIKKCKVLNVDKLGYVYVATDFFGIYKSVEPVTAVEENKYISEVSINPYPNPLSQSTSIRFNLPESSYSSLKIYDIFGSEIETVFSGYLDAGEHKYNWEASGRANGAYYYRLQAGNEMKTGVMILNN